MKNTNRRMQKWAGGFAVLLAIALFTGCSSGNQTDTDTADSPDAAPATPAPAPVPAPPAPPAAVTPPVRIKAGATEPMKDSAGNVWALVSLPCRIGDHRLRQRGHGGGDVHSRGSTDGAADAGGATGTRRAGDCRDRRGHAA